MPNVSHANSLSTNSDSSCITSFNGNVKCWGSQSANLDFNATISVFGKVAQPDTFQQTIRELDRVSIDWVQPYAGDSTVDKYRVRWSLDGQSWTEEESIAPSFGLGGLAPNQEINFRIAAHNDAGWSAEAEHVATTLKSPEVPVGLEQVTKTPTSISLAWDAPASDGLTIDKYKLEWSSGDSNWSQQEVYGLTGVISGLTPATTYRVRVSAHSAAGWSQTSTFANATTTAKAGSPSALTQTARTATSVTFNWAAPDADGISIEKYKVEWSTNGTTWSEGEVNSVSYTITGLVAATSYRVRVSAFTAAGWGSASAESLLNTSGTGAMSLVVATESGVPVSGGALTWATIDNRFRSASAVSADISGRVTMNSVVAGTGRVNIVGGVLPGNITVSGAWDVSLTSGTLTLVVPDAPATKSRETLVRLPNGVAVDGAHVTIAGAGNASASKSSFTYSYLLATGDTSTTDAGGIAVVDGFDKSPVDVYAEYSDPDLSQKSLPQPLSSGLNLVMLDYMPWVEMTVANSTPSPGTSVPVEFTALENIGPALALPRIRALMVALDLSTTQPLAGVSVSISAPAGAPTSTPSCRPTLSGTTNALGKVTLRVCATRTGRYIISTRGAINSGDVQLSVTPVAPLAPAALTVKSTVKGRAALTWSAPSFDGGKPVTSYLVVMSRAGQKVTRTTKSRSIVVTGLKRKKTYVATVKACNSVGCSTVKSSKIKIK